MEDWRSVCEGFEVDPEQGLDRDQVEEGAKKYGPNGESHAHKALIQFDTRHHPQHVYFRGWYYCEIQMTESLWD